MKIEITKVCPFCGAMSIVEVEEKAYAREFNAFNCKCIRLSF